jgi:cytochrome b pre-mRNA-processing protein 3
MLTWFTTRNELNRKAHALYGAVVAQAREPAFYVSYGVPDSAEGRYEMIALHLVLLLERLGAEGPHAEELRRETLETFIVDMDDAMREFGVGDTKVPKTVKKAAAGVYARGVAYREALVDPAPGALDQAITKHVYLHGCTAPIQFEAAHGLAQYVRMAVADLAVQPGADLLDGRVRFAAPARAE